MVRESRAMPRPWLQKEELSGIWSNSQPAAAANTKAAAPARAPKRGPTKMPKMNPAKKSKKVPTPAVRKAMIVPVTLRIITIASTRYQKPGAKIVSKNFAINGPQKAPASEAAGATASRSAPIAWEDRSKNEAHESSIGDTTHSMASTTICQRKL